MSIPTKPHAVNINTTSHNHPTPPNRSIEVLSVEPGATPGVIAVVGVRVGGIVIRGVRVTNRGRGTFCNMPSRKAGDKWIEVVSIVSPALHAAVVEVILAAVGGMR